MDYVPNSLRAYSTTHCCIDPAAAPGTRLITLVRYHVPYHIVNLNTTFSVIAVRINLDQAVMICNANMYMVPDNIIDIKQFRSQQLLNLLVILGDLTSDIQYGVTML